MTVSLPKTGRGRPALQPAAGRYEPDPPVSAVQGSDGMLVSFSGEDGRSRGYSFAKLPLPGMHDDLAAAFAARVGPAGGRRTAHSADMTWQALVALLRFLTGLPRPPRDLAALTVAHLEHYRRRRLLTSKDLCVTNQMTEVFLLLRCADTRLRPEVRELVHQRGHHMGRYAGRQGLPGYSDREYGEIVRAARREVAQIRDRIMAGERLLALANTAPGQLCSNDRLKAEWLTEMARTGEVPRFAGGYGNWPHANLPDWARQVWAAGHLFLTDKDLVPLLVLGGALTERNPETVKELPASHRLLEQRAVAVGITKRRRGKALSRDTLHWEIGPESRQLHTPGGFYLLLHMLTRRSRAFSGTSSIWSIWTGRAALHGHAGPFDRSLARNLFLTKWAAAQGITADVPDGTAPQPIILRLDRLKTAAEVRRARAVGGHMPSVATTNTMDVSYQHYLRDDPVIRSWADDILTAAQMPLGGSRLAPHKPPVSLGPPQGK
jgi:hypothetical protein